MEYIDLQGILKDFFLPQSHPSSLPQRLVHNSSKALTDPFWKYRKVAGTISSRAFQLMLRAWWCWWCLLPAPQQTLGRKRVFKFSIYARRSDEGRCLGRIRDLNLSEMQFYLKLPPRKSSLTTLPGKQGEWKCSQKSIKFIKLSTSLVYKLTKPLWALLGNGFLLDVFSLVIQ